jgi:hypothetical protein
VVLPDWLWEIAIQPTLVVTVLHTAPLRQPNVDDRRGSCGSWCPCEVSTAWWRAGLLAQGLDFRRFV